MFAHSDIDSSDFTGSKQKFKGRKKGVSRGIGCVVFVQCNKVLEESMV